MIHVLSSVLALTIAAEPALAEQQGWSGRSIVEVQNAARHNDKTAAFELGLRYETGRDGVPCDLAKAKKWYMRAVPTTGGTTPAYSAPVGQERFGRLVEVGSGRIVPGSPGAVLRLVVLQMKSPHTCQSAKRNDGTASVKKYSITRNDRHLNK